MYHMHFQTIRCTWVNICLIRAGYEYLWLWGRLHNYLRWLHWLRWLPLQSSDSIKQGFILSLSQVYVVCYVSIWS